METVLKNLFLSLSKNKTATHLAKKHGLKLGARRFVAGESLQEAVTIARSLNEQGMMATMDHLGEFVYTKEEALESVDECLHALEAIYQNELQANLSVKLTQLGLDISTDFCLENMRTLLEKAREVKGFIRIDMEDYARNEKTIEMFRTLLKEYPGHVGLVIQAYLYKSMDDIQSLGDVNLRICKGAYKESDQVAFPEKQKVDENYLLLVKTHLQNGRYAGIATHDEAMIKDLLAFIEQESIPREQFEFQMLYGIRNDLLKELSQKGYRTRVYIPYGNDWYGYFMRRLAERPANVWFVLKNTFK